MRQTPLILFLVVAASACERPVEEEPRFTLYRNSPLDQSLRVHWGTFDARESDPGYNRHICMMTARLLNANANALDFIHAGEEMDSEVGFWCEPGGYSETGSVPTRFAAEYPTDVPEAQIEQLNRR